MRPDGANMDGTARYRRWKGVGARVGVLAGALCLIQSVAYAQQPPGGAPAPQPKSGAAAKPAGAAGATAPGAAAAGSKPNLAEAKKQFQTGEAKFKEGDYATSLAAFQASDAIKPTPQNARYIALSQDKLGQYPEAVAAYERFIAEVPANMKKDGEAATARVAEIKALPGKVHVESTPASAQLTVDGRPAASPTPADIDLPPGKHALHIAADGYVSKDQDIEVAYGSKQDVKVELEAVPPPAPPPPPPVAEAPPPPPPETPAPAPRSKVPAFVTGGVALAAAGVGTVFGIMALSDKSDFDKTPTSSKADDGENHALIADMAIGVAITLGITSAVLFFSAEEPAAKPAAKAAPRKVIAAPKAPPVTIRPTPIVTPHGGGAGALIRF
ncbi:PEGA domain-containing protein [Pendulispora rubella]|uniref:PEGA domain-containing protein n=1 Tax=Pendulispora rubella TaxID=2741070 RepID=A0ABZ2LA26_9BACT